MIVLERSATSGEVANTRKMIAGLAVLALAAPAALAASPR
jgi:hypothetical protein